jgi:hypothetical protein
MFYKHIVAGGALVSWALPAWCGQCPGSTGASRLGSIGWSALQADVALGGKWLPLMCWPLVAGGVLSRGCEARSSSSTECC